MTSRWRGETRNAQALIRLIQYHGQLPQLPGRHILRELGFFSTMTRHPPDLTPVPREIRNLITIAPISRNIHPDLNRGRRLARATALLRRIDTKTVDVSFVDTTAYRNNRALAVVAVSSAQWIFNSATILTREPEVAEQVTVALAVPDSNMGSHPQ